MGNDKETERRSAQDNRIIRVFISSTFQDMQDERTKLIRKTFPRLREMAVQRDVTLTEVDLRWGITKEESESGKVMEICLREVENSIPFFVGIIGNRYGWIPAPEDISEIVEERFPEVPKYVERHLSATEIEMQFGVLDRTDVDMNAYFFIKEEETSDIDDPERLAALKKAVRENKKYPVSTYKDPEDLAEQVLAAFTKLLDDLFPVGELSALEKERLGQLVVLNNLSRVYIKTESNFAVIDKWMKDWEKHQLVITGASGLGKSALVANWIKEKLKLGEELPYRIIYHFVGYGGSVGSDWHVVKALCDEIRDRYGFEADKSEPKTDEKALDDLFKRVAFEGDKPLLIVLDGINQIIDVNYAKRLNWLPIPPKKVKILFTTLEDDGTMEVFKDRHYPIFTLQPLTREERIEMVRRYLDTTYRKHLEDSQLERIVVDPQNENTLVLKTLLDEIANFGSFELLDEKIEEYLKPDSISDFYQVVLQNYEADFGEELVRHFLNLIALSRNGLSEDEILEITDTKDKPILWSQFFCSFSQHLVVKNGLVSFAHSYIREAVEERYIKDQDEWVKTCRDEIVAVLENQSTPEGKKTTRSMDEVPYQLDLLEDMTKLHTYLMDLEVFSYLCKTEETTLGKYWGRLIGAGYSFANYLHLVSNNNPNCLPLLKELRDFNETMRLDDDLVIVFDEQVLQYELAVLLDAYKKHFGKEHPYFEEFSKTAVFYADNDICLNQNYVYMQAYKTVTFAFKSLELCQILFGQIHPKVAESYDVLYRSHKLLLQYRMWKHHEKERGKSELFSFQDTAEESGWKLKALEIRKKIYGDNHPDVAKSYMSVGGESNNLKALEILKAIYGDNHPNVAMAYNAVGGKENNLKALEILKSIYGDNHPSIAKAYNVLGGLCNKLKALEVLRSIYGDNQIDVANTCSDIAFEYFGIDSLRKAIEYKLKEYEIRNKLFHEDYPLVGISSDDYLSIYSEDGIPSFLELSRHRFGYVFGHVKVNVLIIPNNVTRIGEFAFCGCKDLTEIHIPDSVTSIGDGPFILCPSLTKITVSPNNKIFDSREDCNAVIDTRTDVLVGGCQRTIIPLGVTGIGRYAFFGCKGLEIIRIPAGVTCIGENAFSFCARMAEIQIPDGVTEIGCDAFAGCRELKSIILPKSVTSIENGTFDSCTGLTEIHIPASVTSIGDNAFRCTGLTEIHIPDSVTSIGYNAFEGCTGLTEIHIPENVTSIEKYAFNDCSDLAGIAVSPGNRAYDSRNGCNAIVETGTNILIAGCKNTIIQDSVSEIGDGAFCGCTTLTSIEIPDSVTGIGINAFNGCTGLTEIRIPAGVISIRDDAFKGCTGLKEIHIPSGVTEISGSAFRGCTALNTIYLPKGLDIALTGIPEDVQIIRE